MTPIPTVESKENNTEQMPDVATHEATTAPKIGHNLMTESASQQASQTTSRRLKTYGEKKFNWLTYGGFALLGNEAASLVITTLAEDQHGNARGIYKPFKKFFTDMKGPQYASSGNLPKVLIALVGGMLMVPFVKNMEDHKGEKVREYDRKHYGNRVDSDPAFIAAHQEMDEAPKQSWGSLWKGRIVTVLAAIGVDSMIGWKDAPSTKLVEKITKPGSAWNNYSSMDRIATQIAEKSLKLFKATPETHPNANKWIQRGSWLMVLSSTLTLLFYMSSQVFAKKRDEKAERRAHRINSQANTDMPLTPESSAQALTDNVTIKPQPKVSEVEHLATIQAPQALAHSI